MRYKAVTVAYPMHDGETEDEVAAYVADDLRAGETHGEVFVIDMKDLVGVISDHHGNTIGKVTREGIERPPYSGAD